jgi:glycine cleavage system H lipoate-binding protein/ABC-type phosphate transport system substrate-binding protein
MKTISILTIGLSLLISNQMASAINRSDNPNVYATGQSMTNTAKISSSPELYNLAQNWVKDYNAANPSSMISVEQTITGKAETAENLFFVSDENAPALTNLSNWKMVVGRDIIVPITSAKNPMVNQLTQIGISAEEFALLFKGTESKNWSVCVPNGQNVPVQIYVSDKQYLLTSLEAFTKTSIASANIKRLYSTEELISAVQNDQFSIGFCKLSDLRTMNIYEGTESVRLLPIDKNGNGRLENFENIYGSPGEFTHGVWIGKYPNALCENVYAVSITKPTQKSELAFLSWVLGEGQKSLNTNGYCDLTSSEKESSLASLLGGNTGNPNLSSIVTSPKSWPVMLTIAGLVGLFLVIFFYSKSSSGSIPVDPHIQLGPLMIEKVMDVPKGLYFDKTHTWAFMEQDGNVRIGIDDFLQHITGKLTKIKMREAGEQVRKGETIMTIIQEGKQLNIYAPISGTILEQNESLLTDTGIINASPFFKGWVYQIEPKNWLREVQFMFMGDKYAEWLKDEFTRLKDFIAATVRSNNLAYAHVVLQDGGEITDNVLAEMDPKVWEDFQTQFIDSSR